MTHTQIVEYLRDIASAAMKPSNAPVHLGSLHARERMARLIGEELNKRGGFELMRSTLERDLGWCPGCRTIERFWNRIGDWLG
jgi:hypothetical protein